MNAEFVSVLAGLTRLNSLSEVLVSSFCIELWEGLARGEWQGGRLWGELRLQVARKWVLAGTVIFGVG